MKPSTLCHRHLKRSAHLNLDRLCRLGWLGLGDLGNCTSQMQAAGNVRQVCTDPNLVHFSLALCIRLRKTTISQWLLQCSPKNQAFKHKCCAPHTQTLQARHGMKRQWLRKCTAPKVNKQLR
eukprot:1161923-Pelagomonas_calceolata.AAC.18